MDGVDGEGGLPSPLFRCIFEGEGENTWGELETFQINTKPFWKFPQIPFSYVSLRRRRKKKPL